MTLKVNDNQYGWLSKKTNNDHKAIKSVTVLYLSDSSKPCETCIPCRSCRTQMQAH